MTMTLEQVSEILTGASLTIETVKKEFDGYVHEYLYITGSLVKIPVALSVNTEGSNPDIRMHTYVQLKETVTFEDAVMFAQIVNSSLTFCEFYVVEEDGEQDKYMNGEYYLDIEHPVGDKLLMQEFSQLSVGGANKEYRFGVTDMMKM
jgi:hypothetical protein